MSYAVTIGFKGFQKQRDKVERFRRLVQGGGGKSASRVRLPTPELQKVVDQAGVLLAKRFDEHVAGKTVSDKTKKIRKGYIKAGTPIRVARAKKLKGKFAGSRAVFTGYLRSVMRKLAAPIGTDDGTVFVVRRIRKNVKGVEIGIRAEAFANTIYKKSNKPGQPYPLGILGKPFKGVVGRKSSALLNLDASDVALLLTDIKMRTQRHMEKLMKKARL